ncbi:hypothetical protein Dimus_029563, partial [Dionaea muscipula]
MMKPHGKSHVSGYVFSPPSPLVFPSQSLCLFSDFPPASLFLFLLKLLCSVSILIYYFHLQVTHGVVEAVVLSSLPRESMDSDTQSSNSRTNPQRPVSILNRRAPPPRPEEGEARLLDSTGSTPKVGDTEDKHKESKLCVERTEERERDRRVE